ncbi:MAG: prenyltransferase/squalene oxidase repeat-containing protein, partial [Patescibacteria group bacterium]|nr:prenyltransferase/squalene oxidase repeat-containing protein [Patescibacteria group bacterium]
ARAAGMLDWLVSIQLADGAFQGGCIGQEPVQPAVFDTGQILLGLAAGVAEFSEDRYKQSLHRAAGWLLDRQASDGSWPQEVSPCALPGPKAYETHVAWGLLEAGRVSGNTAYVDAALGNVRWAIGHQHANGWFEKCCLTNPAQPLTHTLGYALRGVLEAYRVTHAGQYLDSAERTASGLLSALQADGGIPGRLNSQWRPAARWVCLTGNVQIAICWFMLHRFTGKDNYLHAAKLANAFVRRTVRTTGPEEQRGGVKGAFPVAGEYGRYQYLNWAAKFFIDAHVLESDLTGSPQEPDSGKPNGE